MDTELARFNMIQQQIRPWEVLDPRVLQAIQDTPRERFVPDAYKHLAFADIHIPLSHDQVMMQPKQEARLIQALELKSTDNILEVGTGSGYVTALLRELGGAVDTVDIHGELLESAQDRLTRIGYQNISFYQGDACKTWDGGPYDAIVLTGSVSFLPEEHQSNLAPGGRLVAVVGAEPVMEAILIERLGKDEFRTTSLFDTSIPPLINAEAKATFVF